MGNEIFEEIKKRYKKSNKYMLCNHYDNWCEKEKRSCKHCYWDNDFDFIVGFTLFTPKGFKTMYRHFPTLEMAKMFASNVNIKNNCKIYVDLDFYNKKGK